MKITHGKTLTLTQTDEDGREHTIVCGLDGMADVSRVNPDGGRIFCLDFCAMLNAGKAWAKGVAKAKKGGRR